MNDKNQSPQTIPNLLPSKQNKDLRPSSGLMIKPILVKSNSSQSAYVNNNNSLTMQTDMNLNNQKNDQLQNTQQNTSYQCQDNSQTNAFTTNQSTSQNQNPSQLSYQQNGSFSLATLERRDRKGHEIKKGNKVHHITFKDQLPLKIAKVNLSNPAYSQNNGSISTQQKDQNKQQQYQVLDQDVIFSKGAEEDENLSSYDESRDYSYYEEDDQEHNSQFSHNSDSHEEDKTKSSHLTYSKDHSDDTVATIKLEGDSTLQNYNYNPQTIINQAQQSNYNKSHNDNSNNQNNHHHKKRKQKRRKNIQREPLHEIIFVESYKEYNAQGANWYSNQCCQIF